MWMRKIIFTLHTRGFAMYANAKGALNTFFNAVRANDVNKTIELLKSQLVKVDSRDETSDDQTALHITAENGYYDLARVLVDEYNAPVNIADKDGNIPLQLATDRYNMKIVKFLLKRNSKMREYTEHNLNDDAVEELFEAAESNDITKIVELLKDKKVDVNSRDKSNYNRTILHVAAANGNEELVRRLVDVYGANFQQEDDPGDTAKHVAVDNDYPNIAKFLIERGYKDPRPCLDTIDFSTYDPNSIPSENK